MKVIMLINVKMLTIVCILISMSRIKTKYKNQNEINYYIISKRVATPLLLTHREYD